MAKYEPRAYDSAGHQPAGHPLRVAIPEDSNLEANNGDLVASWWLLEDPHDPARSLILLEVEAGWQQPRAIGQSGEITWLLLDEENAQQAGFPFGNGILDLAHGLPGGATRETVRIDGRPGLRGDNYTVDHSPESNGWQVRAESAAAAADFAVDEVVPGSYGPYFGPSGQLEATNIAPVANSRVTGTARLGDRIYDLNGWRAQYWRMNFPAVADSQVHPETAWGGWEWVHTFEPDGGYSEFQGIIDSTGVFRGYMVDGRPGDIRICDRVDVRFDDYRWGRSMYGDTTAPYQQYTIPGRITVTCAPGQGPQMTKTFVPDSADYFDGGHFAYTEMPVHTVAGSMGSYEHIRFDTFQARKYHEGTGR
ncbi:hypothetical protein [Nocardia sp. BMG111209]|uniref:hypothetical protein n=1 Tax=Nocardia sp. BMG111209 TaxID=1160137 RepID=UPI00035C5C0D|nr:hypothetical protein [Nocardia sp. BMG111209]